MSHNNHRVQKLLTECSAIFCFEPEIVEDTLQVWVPY